MINKVNAITLEENTVGVAIPVTKLANNPAQIPQPKAPTNLFI